MAFVLVWHLVHWKNKITMFDTHSLFSCNMRTLILSISNIQSKVKTCIIPFCYGLIFVEILKKSRKLSQPSLSNRSLFSLSFSTHPSTHAQSEWVDVLTKKKGWWMVDTHTHIETTARDAKKRSAARRANLKTRLSLRLSFEERLVAYLARLWNFKCMPLLLDVCWSGQLIQSRMNSQRELASKSGWEAW